MSVKISEIHGTGGFFRTGDIIRSIDGKRIEDQLDLYFILSGIDSAVFAVERENGRTAERRLRVETLERAEPVFEEMRFTRCASRCIFCFVDQMPAGMRDTLYFKDDDYRLSFLFGNYITLNDIRRRDIRRITEYSLSPLYVSVHATDRKVREKIFGRPMKSGIMEVLTELAESGITIHAQVVVMPGVNDGRVLRRTAIDLFSLYPAVASLAVVPVGLTGHRTGLTKLERIGPAQAREILDSGKSLNASFIRKSCGDNFVYMSDEFYLLTGRNFPEASFYGAFEQLSNGVGMCRLFIDSVEERLRRLKSRKSPPAGSMTIVTGRLGSRLMRRQILPRVERALPGLEVRLVTADNGTFGHSVTVSGLLAGRDIEAAVSKAGIEGGILVLPPNTVNHEGRLLDDIRPAALGKKLGMKVMVPKEDFLEDRILREAGSRIS